VTDTPDYDTLIADVTVSNTAGTPDSASSSGGSNYGIQAMGLLQVGSTGGTFGLEWAQHVNQGGYNLSLLAGSYIYLTRVA
jgi:hypothetical protein